MMSSLTGKSVGFQGAGALDLALLLGSAVVPEPAAHSQFLVWGSCIRT